MKNSLKIAVIGDTFVGTSSIVDRFVYDTFDRKCLPTIGVDYRYKVDGDYIYQIYVASGLFCCVAKNYVSVSNYFIFVYDISNRLSFERVEKHYKLLFSSSPNKPKMYLVGNKNDIDENDRKFSKDEGFELASKYSMTFYEVSALNGYGINHLFDEIKQESNIKDFKKNVQNSSWASNIFSCCCNRM